MSAILELIARQLDGESVQNLASQVGATPQQTAAAVHAALPALLGALQGNAATAGGAQSLLAALDRDHDGSILDDVAGFFGQGPTPADSRSVHHILGDRREPVAQAVAQRSGLDAAQVMRLLAMLAPIVLGALSRARRQGGAGPEAGLLSQGGGGLGDLLGAALSGLQGGAAGGGGLGDLLGGLLGGRGGDGEETDREGEAGDLGDLLGGLLNPNR